MKQRFSIFGAAAGVLFGLLVVLISDGTSPSALIEFTVRATVVCIFAAMGAAAGLLAGWMFVRFLRKR